jgi:hypothetical protein
LDYETDKSIINPYISLEKIDKGGVCLNTETFRDCQSEMIHPLEFCRRMEFAEMDNISKFYRVEAVVGEYNGVLPGLGTSSATVSFTRPERSRTLLGYLEKSVVKENLPKSFKALNKD